MDNSLQNGIDTLLFLAARKSAGVTEIAEALHVNTSAASNILDTFLQSNMVEKNQETQKYRLGPAILRLSERYYNSFKIIESARTVMEKLTFEIRESVHLCLLSNYSAIIIEQTLSTSRLVISAMVGNSEPLHCSSVGKCLLAFASDVTRERMIANMGFEVFTEKTITTKEKLLAEIAKVRELGYAVDDQELSMDIRCVAVPVFDGHGKCLYSLGTSGAASVMTAEKIEKIVPLMQQAAKDIMKKKKP